MCSTDATYFPDRAAQIFYRPPLVAGAHITFAPVASADVANATATVIPPTDTSSAFTNLKSTLANALPGSTSSSRDVQIGSIGILHPSVLAKFDLDFPCSAVEFDLQPFL